MMKGKIEVYTDGACSYNPGPGGWAAIVDIDDEVHIVKNYCIHTTNNRMELTAVIEALKYLRSIGQENEEIKLVSDSSYVINAINKKWIEGWLFNGWKNSKGYNIKNKDLWLKFIDERKNFSNIKFEWCKGHAGNSLNEAADTEAVSMVALAVERSGVLQ